MIIRTVLKALTITSAITLICMTSIITSSMTMAATGDWFRDAAISPDGKTILFSNKGDIYSVPVEGGRAIPLTLNKGWDGNAIYSADGRWIAFASDRYGNLDVFVMPASGGTAQRLTHHSTDDIPTSFTADSKGITFTSARQDKASSALFPRRSMTELYTVSIEGGTPKQELTTPASEARWSKNGRYILYREEKGLESDLRKHDNSAVARDIWLYDSKKKSHTQLTTNSYGDHTPIWGVKKNQIYFLSDRSGTYNVWRMNQKSGKKEQLTKHNLHPVRSLAIANNNMLVYTWHGNIYTLNPESKTGSKPTNIKVTLGNDRHGLATVAVPLKGRITEFVASPSGKEIAFVSRGEVFVTSKDFATTKRITNTAEQERQLSFSSDGKTLYYASERGGKWRIYSATRAEESEKYFFVATSIKEALIIDADNDAFGPKVSPDGKKIAFVYDRHTIQIHTLKTAKTVTVLAEKYNYSYSDGDITFNWSPDSKWLTVDYAANDRLFFTNIAVVPADGSSGPRNLYQTGYTETSPVWHSSGETVMWFSARYGLRDHGSHGAQFDVVASFLTQDAYDKFHLSKEEYELIKELEKESDESKDADSKGDESKDKKKDDKEKVIKPININFDRLTDRSKRLTLHSSDLAGAALTPEMDKLYYLSRFEKGYDLWVQDFREEETKKIAKLGADQVSMQLSKDGKSAILLVNGKLKSINLEDGKVKAVAVQSLMEIKEDDERRYMFDHVWYQVRDKFYNPDLHNVDWQVMYEQYAVKIEGINNNRDFAELLSELLGELNASHTGGRYRPRISGVDATGSLGLVFDEKPNSKGLKITEVIAKGPLDHAGFNVKAGMVLTHINGTQLKPNVNIHNLLNNTSGKRVRLSFDGSKDRVVKPINQRAKNNLLYDRWVEARRKSVEQLSNGRLGYIHVRSMADSSYRTVYSEMFGRNFNKEGLIIDTRFNGGGDLTNDLVRLLSGKQYTSNTPEGRTVPGEPLTQWTKPTSVLISEGNYSDAHCFPMAYKALGIGKLIGMPVAGTCTYVWWERLHTGDVVFGIPNMGVLGSDGKWWENKQLEPDVKVKNLPTALSKGEDQQLIKAVEVMLKDIAETALKR